MQLNFEEVIRIHNERKRAHRSATQTSTQTTVQAPKVPTPGTQMKIPSTQTTAQAPKVPTPGTQMMIPIEQTPNSPQQIETSDACISLSLPGDIEIGSVVVFTVNNRSCPAKSVLQAYIANGPGQLTPVALPPNLQKDVGDFMKKNTPNASSSVLSPGGATSVDSNRESSVVLPSPSKRQRQSSFTTHTQMK